MRLSICAIYGNESVHIERFLASFGKIADEFVLVRAIGRAEPDATKFIAQKICDPMGMPVIFGEYENARDERASWLHVDDFAAARQDSFDYATGDWVAWADLDDVWPETEANAGLIERIKSSKMDEFSLIHINYEVPNARAMVARERFAKRKACPKWSNPIHEGFNVMNGKRVYVDDASIVHSPLTDKKESAPRNLRILDFATSRPDLYPDQSILWFYRHRELVYMGKKVEAVEAADRALALMPKGLVESGVVDEHTILLYEVLLITAEIALERGDKSDARARAHGAVNVMPGRREAYAVLAQIECGARNFKKMLAYTSAMRGIDCPTGMDRCWTQRDSLYSWHGAFLYHQALRLNGQIARAEECEEEVFQLEGAKITIIHPTMLRADLALDTYGKWMDVAKNPGQVQWIFAIDDADEYSKQVLRAYKTVICPRGARKAAEYAKKFASGKRVEVIGDYSEPVAGWDEEFQATNRPLPWKLAAPYEGYPNIIQRTGSRYIICGKEGKSENPDFQPQHCHFELGWEQGTSHVYAKWLVSQGRLTNEDIIVTLPGREFLYQGSFNEVITWQTFCEWTNLKYGTPYRDVSCCDTLDLVEYFERNWHRYDQLYFSGPDNTWNGGAWDRIQSFKPSLRRETEPFILVSLRKRPHESRRDTPDDFGREVLQSLHDALGLKIYLVGLNLPDYGVPNVHGVTLQDFATLMQLPECVGILGPHSGPNGLAGLLAPKDKNIIIFPMEFCPSINSNYPTGMGKCLNLNGNIRHWLPVLSSPSDIAAKAKEVLLPCLSSLQASS